MGHGTKTHLIVKGGKEVHRRKELIEPFTEIEWLKNKPKLFFIQACAVRKRTKSVTTGKSMIYCYTEILATIRVLLKKPNF